MTHIENISHILQYGITHSTSPNANPTFVPIGDRSLINKRSSFTLDNDRRLGEYIPFYFGCRMPMLFVIQNGYNMVTPTPAENIVYCVSSVQRVIDQKLEFVFTDGHAVDSFSTQFTENDVENIESVIDMVAIKAMYWKNENDLDLKRRKEAEFLILGDIKPDAILGYIAFSQSAKDLMVSFGANEPLVHVKPDRYF
jgi:ssDNA thymidine ADP-ribosyltransferase, DarT